MISIFMSKMKTFFQVDQEFTRLIETILCCLPKGSLSLPDITNFLIIIRIEFRFCSW